MPYIGLNNSQTSQICLSKWQIRPFLYSFTSIQIQRKGTDVTDTRDSFSFQKNPITQKSRGLESKPFYSCCHPESTFPPCSWPNSLYQRDLLKFSSEKNSTSKRILVVFRQFYPKNLILSVKKEILGQIQTFFHREKMRCWKWQNWLQLCSDYLKNKQTNPPELTTTHFTFFSPFSLGPWPLPKPSPYVNFPRQLQWCCVWICCWFIPSLGNQELSVQL